MSDQSSDAQMLRAYLAAHDSPCPACGYSLRGLEALNCPECGQNLALTVGPGNPRFAAWFAGMLGAAAAAGFNGLLLLHFVVVYLRTRRAGIDFFTMFVGVNLVGLVVMSLVLAMWLAARRRFAPAPGWQKAAAIAATWLLAVADVLIFSITMR